ncbi:hypothetical protein C8J57DRAFT_1522943 [Mycena rebaudengoi]|nr:hypothetical protein C8J57DRAFT_1522943 [Mycena rebaudengoi]
MHELIAPQKSLRSPYSIVLVPARLPVTNADRCLSSTQLRTPSVIFKIGHNILLLHSSILSSVVPASEYIHVPLLLFHYPSLCPPSLLPLRASDLLATTLKTLCASAATYPLRGAFSRNCVVLALIVRRRDSKGNRRRRRPHAGAVLAGTSSRARTGPVRRARRYMSVVVPDHIVFNIPSPGPPLLPPFSAPSPMPPIIFRTSLAYLTSSSSSLQCLNTVFHLQVRQHGKHSTRSTFKTIFLTPSYLGVSLSASHDLIINAPRRPAAKYPLSAPQTGSSPRAASPIRPNEFIPPWVTKCMTPNELESTMDAVGAETYRASGINCELLPALPCTSLVSGPVPLLLD